MKLVTMAPAGTPCCGVLVRDKVLLLETAPSGLLPSRQTQAAELSIRSILANPGLMKDAQKLARQAAEGAALLAGHCIPFREHDLLAPIPRPPKLLCLGLNYRDHAAESGAEVPEEPVVFAKLPGSVIGPREPIRLTEASEQIDYEAELAVVIGTPARKVTAAEAMRHVAGYTVLNDVTARDYQRRGGGQWTVSKSFDTFCPLGPWIVTADEIEDPHNLGISCSVNDELMQDSNTSEMIFTIPEIIEYLSAVMTLEPGDVISTGTPPGVGFARRPPRYLQHGDTVSCTVEGVGTLTNPVREEGSSYED